MKVRVCLSKEELKELAIAHFDRKMGLSIASTRNCDFEYEDTDEEYVQNEAIGLWVEFEVNEEATIFHLVETPSKAA